MPHPRNDFGGGNRPLLRVEGLRKSFGTVVAVAGVDLAVAAGEIMGLLGANGAGKTTVVETIAGLTAADSGRIEIAEAAGRARLGVALHASGLPGKLSVTEALRLFASLHHVRDDSVRWIDRFGLAAKADARCETLSQGTAARVGLALALIGDPALILLDEPTAGLDPLARREFHDLLRALRADGCGILITTHDMAEAEALCDGVAILAAGRIVAAGPPASLVTAPGRRIKVRTDRPLAPALVAAIAAGAATMQDGCELVVAGAEPRALVQRLAAALLAEDIELLALETSPPGLDALVVAIAAGSHG